MNEVEKLNAIIDGYQPKIQALKVEIAELKAENEQLKALCDTYKTCYQAKHSDIKCLFIKYKQTLQEIKEIAAKNQFYFSPGTIVSYETIKQLATSFEQILGLITKAEEE